MKPCCRQAAAPLQLERQEDHCYSAPQGVPQRFQRSLGPARWLLRGRQDRSRTGSKTMRFIACDGPGTSRAATADCTKMTFPPERVRPVDIHSMCASSKGGRRGLRA